MYNVGFTHGLLWISTAYSRYKAVIFGGSDKVKIDDDAPKHVIFQMKTVLRDGSSVFS